MVADSLRAQVEPGLQAGLDQARDRHSSDLPGGARGNPPRAAPPRRSPPRRGHALRSPPLRSGARVAAVIEIVTMSDLRFLPQTLTLHRSLLAHAPHPRMTIICMDEASRDFLQRRRLDGA